MPAFLRTSPKILAATLAAAALLLPVASRAQDLPPYAVAPAQDQQIHGRIESIDGTFNLTVRDDSGYLDAIQLRQGTIINPTGLTLAPGMVVTILGFPSGSVFNANQIDTPYTFSGPAPVPVYYGPGWWYPGFAFGYGPSFSIGFVVGFGGGYTLYRQPWCGHWWAGSPSWYHGGSYAYNGYGHGSNGSNGYAHGYNGYGGQSSGYSGQGDHDRVSPTEPHNLPVSHGPVARTEPYRAPVNTYHAQPGGYRGAPSGGSHAGGGGGGSHGGGGGHH